jgi:hypothetical protein
MYPNVEDILILSILIARFHCISRPALIKLQSTWPLRHASRSRMRPAARFTRTLFSKRARPNPGFCLWVFVARSAPGPSPRPRPRPNLSSRRDAAGRIRLGRRRGVAREAHGRGESERQAYQNQLRGDEDEDGSWIHILASGKVAENSVEPGQQLQ